LPFTPYHFGPSALVGLAFRRWIDVPVIVLVNVAMDFEPLIVMLFNLGYPLHGYIHTLLFGSFFGILWAICSFYFLRRFYCWLMKLLRLPYQPRFRSMLLAGILGVWLHVFLDSIMHPDTRPFWPIETNPFLRAISVSRLYLICEYSIYAAFVLYAAILLVNYRRSKKTF
jgi:membrane-bound metal-dependent hydrolase YbcI (DUF457 family)